MSPRLDGAREASLSRWLAFTPFILQKSRMRRRARTDLCGGRSAMGVPTATVSWNPSRNVRSIKGTVKRKTFPIAGIFLASQPT